MKLNLYRSDLTKDSKNKQITDISLSDFYWYVDHHIILHCHQVYFIDTDGSMKKLKDIFTYEI